MNPLSLNFSEAFLLELIFKGVIVMVAAFVITFLFRRSPAALRHAVWSLAFIGLLLLPIGSAVLPAWEVTVPVDGTGEATSSAVVSASAQAETIPQRASANRPELHPSESPAVPVSHARRASWTWSQILLVIWTLGAAGLLVRLASVLFKLSVLRRRSSPVEDSGWIEQAECIAEALDIRRPVQLLQHDDVVVPMTYGVRNAVIFLPRYARHWSREQMHATLMHELLHVKRYDHLVQVLALSARALHWFNPLTWVAAKQLIVERERACDDGVLEMGVASSSYADHLLGLARQVLSGREAPTAALAMARPSELHTRIVAILDPAVPRRALSRLRAAGVTAFALVLFVSLAAMQPGRVPLESAQVETAQVERAQLESTWGENAQVESEQRANVSESHTILELADAAPPQAAARTAGQDTRVGDEAESDTTDLEAQRRAIHAISELPESRSVPLLTEIARTHENPELRREAVFWLGQVGATSTGELLESIARNDADPDLQRQALFALAELDDRGGIAALTGLARTHPNDEMRAEAVFWLGEGGGPETVEALETFARSDASVDVQKKAVFALAEVEDGAGVASLIELARTHPDPDVRSDAIFWLGESGDERAADVLMEIVNQN